MAVLSNMPTVAIAHTPERNRSIERAYAMVREALEKIGGFEAFVKPGESVFIKPDQNGPQLAEQGATTDPLLVGAIVRLAWEAGASSVKVGAATASPVSSIECMQATGIAAVCAKEGAELVDLGSADVPDREVELPEAIILDRVRLPVSLLDSDVIIAVPKARTDSLDIIAGSIELCTGGINQDWRALQTSKEDAIGRLADVMTVLRADLWIVDAIICGEGDGPHANLPHWAGCILASADPVATDTAIAMLLGRDPGRLLFAKAAEDRGLGYSAPVVFLGKPLESFAFKAWPSHETFGHLPINVLVGKDVTEAGTVGYVKSAFEALVREGVLPLALHNSGTPTILIGDAEDTEFESHLQEGPYIVFDDAAQPRYKTDPRVHFIPGHPVGNGATRQLREILLARNRKDTAEQEESGELVPQLVTVELRRQPVSATRPFAVALACAGVGLALCLREGKHR